MPTGPYEMEPRLRGFCERVLLAQPFYGWVAGSNMTLARFQRACPRRWLSALKRAPMFSPASPQP